MTEAERIARIEFIAKAAASGMTMQEVGDVLGVSRQRVDQIAKREGIEFPFSPWGLKRKRLAVAKAADTSSITRRELADALGVSPITVTNWGVKCKREPKPHPRVDQIKALAAQGLTVSEIARTLGIPQANVSTAKARYGITFLRDGRSSQ